MNEAKSALLWCVSHARLELARPLVMGILNVTPDSFSDGGLHSTLDAAVLRAFEIHREGADIIDIGGESSRPGSSAVETDVEMRRVIPVIERIMVECPQTIVSVDTAKAEVARAALDAGAHIVNDITAGMGDPEMVDVVRRSDCGVVLMHMRGTPKSMQVNPEYDDVVMEIREFLQKRIDVFSQAGITRDRIVIDPGIGFGKKLEHNIALLRGIDELKDLGCPVLVGASRKAMLGEITGRPIGERQAASIAVTLAAINNGASILRVHDVKETVDAVNVWCAINQS